jgi:hypothetical protein
VRCCAALPDAARPELDVHVRRHEPEGDLYIHPASELRNDAGDWSGPLLALAVAAAVARVRPR